MTFDDGIQAMGDDEIDILPPADDKTSKSPAARPQSSVELLEDTSSTAEAPQRRKKAPKPIEIDQQTELHNHELQEWHRNYLENMANAERPKRQARLNIQAKKNAAYWVWGTGLNGVGAELPAGLKHPLGMFAGDALFTALTGIELSPSGQKRTQSPEEVEPDESERHVRLRQEEEQIGRSETGHGEFDDGIFATALDEDIEIGRDAQVPLEEQSSQMPWNLSSSKHGSRTGSTRPLLGTGFGGYGSSAGGLSSFGGFGLELGPPPLRPASRRTSASPLMGRGLTVERLSSLDIPEAEFGGGLGSLDLGDEEDLLAVDDEEFQLYGPAAAVDTQTAAQSQWMRDTLDQEGSNFLEFLITEVWSRKNVADTVESEDASAGGITFERLLPPQEHSKIVAAQGLLHVLALATKGIVKVEQHEGYGEIYIAVST